MNMGKGIMFIPRFAIKVLYNERKIFNTSWNHWLHCRTNCVSDHWRVQIIKIVDNWILFKKIRNHSQPLKLQQNVKICHKFT